MSISAVNGDSPTTQQPGQSQGVTAIPSATSFSQELDAQSAQAKSAHGHHHHHGGASQSATSSPATAASAAGVASPSTVGASLLKLLP